MFGNYYNVTSNIDVLPPLVGNMQLSVECGGQESQGDTQGTLTSSCSEC